jgi:hypothetical protein
MAAALLVPLRVCATTGVRRNPAGRHVQSIRARVIRARNRYSRHAFLAKESPIYKPIAVVRATPLLGDFIAKVRVPSSDVRQRKNIVRQRLWPPHARLGQVVKKQYSPSFVYYRI